MGILTNCFHRKLKPCNYKMTNTRGLISGYLFVSQIIFTVLFGFFVEYHPEHTGAKDNSNEDQKAKIVEDAELYPLFQDVHVMMLVGIGFLLSFLKRHGYGSLGFNFLLTCYVIQWALLVNGWFGNIGTGSGMIQLSLKSFLHADFTVATILISFCCILGVASPTQLVVMATLEVVFYNVGVYVCLEGLQLTDVGGTIVIHVFACYFGLAVSFVLGKFAPSTNEKEASSYQSDLFAMIGALFLWLFWPSFNAGPATGVDRQRAIINTIMSLSACTSTTFALSAVLNKNNKFDMVHVQNAALAGGVIMGANADFLVQPCIALIMGSVAGIVSVLGYFYVQPALEKAIGLHDTCGVHNLHGMPGILGAFISAILASLATKEEYKDSYEILIKRDDQASFQIYSLLVCIAISLISGAVTGLFMSLPVFDRMTSAELYEDEVFWKCEGDDDIEKKKNELQTMV